MATRVSSACAASISIVFDMESLSLARTGRPDQETGQGCGGSPNGEGGRGARHPAAKGDVGLIKPDWSAGGKAHEVVGPEPGAP
jgi:hypothetical protein